VYSLYYYVRENGDCPCRDWRTHQDGRIAPSIDARIEQLRLDGLKILNTEMMCRVKAKNDKERVPGFYELRHEGKKWRIAVLYVARIQAFILLCGWRKKQRVQPEDIAHARALAREYLDSGETSEGRMQCL
jgi:putative component of toxin-antitoxin plasmid stabilization module